MKEREEKQKKHIKTWKRRKNEHHKWNTGQVTKESEIEQKKRKTREEERSENNELNIERKKRKIRRRQRKDQCK